MDRWAPQGVRSAGGPLTALDIRFVAKTEGTVSSARRPQGRPANPRLSPREREVLAAFMRKESPSAREVAASLDLSLAQLYRIRNGAQGYPGGGAALFDRLLVRPHFGEPCPPESPWFTHFTWRVLGLASLSMAPDRPRWHCSIDYLTFWAETPLDRFSPAVDSLVSKLRALGYRPRLPRCLPRRKRRRGLWALSCTHRDHGFSFRAFQYTDHGGVRPSLKLELKARALRSNRGRQLVTLLLKPLQPRDIRTTRLDLAFDVEVPFPAVLAFRLLLPRVKRTEQRSYSRRIWAGSPSRLAASYVGLKNSAQRCCVYDKVAEVLGREPQRWTLADLRGGRVPGLAHVAGWSFCTRWEVRVTPGRLARRLADGRHLGYAPDLLMQLPNPGETFHVVNLWQLPRRGFLASLIFHARLTSVDDICWRDVADDEQLRARLRESLLRLEAACPWPRMTAMFEESRAALQGEFETILSGLASSTAVP
jgi:hypothetical protein